MLLFSFLNLELYSVISFYFLNEPTRIPSNSKTSQRPYLCSSSGVAYLTCPCAGLALWNKLNFTLLQCWRLERISWALWCDRPLPRSLCKCLRDSLAWNVMFPHQACTRWSLAWSHWEKLEAQPSFTCQAKVCTFFTHCWHQRDVSSYNNASVLCPFTEIELGRVPQGEYLKKCSK